MSRTFGFWTPVALRPMVTTDVHRDVQQAFAEDALADHTGCPEEHHVHLESPDLLHHVPFLPPIHHTAPTSAVVCPRFSTSVERLGKKSMSLES